MQLLLKRSQTKAGMMGNRLSFVSTIRAQYTEEERALINKYDMGGMIIYDSKATQQYLERAGQASNIFKTVGLVALSKMQLSITLASLQKGHQIQSGDLNELLECEEAVKDACKNVKQWIEAAETFDGRDIVVDLDAEQMAN